MKHNVDKQIHQLIIGVCEVCNETKILVVDWLICGPIECTVWKRFIEWLSRQ